MITRWITLCIYIGGKTLCLQQLVERFSCHSFWLWNYQARNGIRSMCQCKIMPGSVLSPRRQATNCLDSFRYRQNRYSSLNTTDCHSRVQLFRLSVHQVNLLDSGIEFKEHITQRSKSTPGFTTTRLTPSFKFEEVESLKLLWLQISLRFMRQSFIYHQQPPALFGCPHMALFFRVNLLRVCGF